MKVIIPNLNLCSLKINEYTSNKVLSVTLFFSLFTSYYTELSMCTRSTMLCIFPEIAILTSAREKEGRLATLCSVSLHTGFEIETEVSQE